MRHTAEGEAAVKESAASEDADKFDWRCPTRSLARNVQLWANSLTWRSCQSCDKHAVRKRRLVRGNPQSIWFMQHSDKVRLLECLVLLVHWEEITQLQAGYIMKRFQPNNKLLVASTQKRTVSDSRISLSQSRKDTRDRFVVATKLNSVAWVRERTIPTEWPPLVVEVSANFCGKRMPRGQRDGSLQTYSRLSRPEPLIYLPSTSSVVLTRLSGPRFSISKHVHV
jgi:hypothetical protein